jgi:hypothetical protein
MGVKKGEKPLTDKGTMIMARKITTLAIDAFMNAENLNCNGYGCVFNLDNTCVTRNNEIAMHLHGNRIARRESGSNSIQITNAGWFSNTTKERLNGIPGVSIQQKKGVWFLNGVEWNGEWINV